MLLRIYFFNLYRNKWKIHLESLEMYKKSMRGGVVFMLAKAEKYKQLEKWNERFKMDVLSRSLTADHS